MRIAAPLLLIAAPISAQSIEQIAPPMPPVAAARSEQPAVSVGNRAVIAQLPPEPRAVEQPMPQRAESGGERGADNSATDAARTYAAVLGGGSAAPVNRADDLSARTIAEAAAAASLTPSARPGVAIRSTKP